MWVVGRILIVILMVMGVLLVVAGTATLIEADNWTGQIDNIDIGSGFFEGFGDGGLALGVLLLAVTIITNIEAMMLSY